MYVHFISQNLTRLVIGTQFHFTNSSCPILCYIQQWEGLIELLGSESKIAGGLEFLHKYELSTPCSFVQMILSHQFCSII